MVLLVALPLAGLLAAGWAGAAAALLVALGLLGALIAGGAIWARRIGVLLEPDAARALAPRPVGFGRLMDRVYDRTLPAGD